MDILADAHVRHTIQSRIPIEEYAKTLTALKPSAGGNFVGPCPMHKKEQGESPSFKVDPETQTFSCTGPCPGGVGIIKLFQTVEGGTEKDAISTLAERFGIELPTTSPGATQERQPRLSDIQVNDRPLQVVGQQALRALAATTNLTLRVCTSEVENQSG